MRRSLSHVMTGILGRRRANEVVVPFLRKEDAACCAARRDADGRLPVGFCSPGCERRHPYQPDDAA